MGGEKRQMRNTKRIVRLKGIYPFRLIQEVVYGVWRSDPVIDDAVCDVKEIWHLQKKIRRFPPIWMTIESCMSLEEVVKKLNDAKKNNGE